MRWLILLILFGVVLATNKWVSWEEGIHLVKAYDVSANYEVIAKNAPSLPPPGISFHHAQRLIVPYCIGLIAKTFGISYQALFFWATVACLLSIAHLLLLFSRDTNIYIFSIGIALFFFNPYISRYYLLAPGMLTDCVFLLGFTVTLYSLLKIRVTLLFLGVFFMAISRQTTVLLIPGIMIWLLVGKQWNISIGKIKYLLTISTAALVFIVYFATKYMVQDISKSHVNMESLLGLIYWTINGYFRFPVFLEFSARILLPLFLYFILFITHLSKIKKISQETKLLFLQFILTITQPILYGPPMSGKNIGRLISLSIIALIFALTHEWKTTNTFANFKPSQAIVILIAIFLLSLHHLYSSLGPNSITHFLAIQLTVPIALFFLLRHFETKNSSA